MWALFASSILIASYLQLEKQVAGVILCKYRLVKESHVVNSVVRSSEGSRHLDNNIIGVVTSQINDIFDFFTHFRKREGVWLHEHVE